MTKGLKVFNVILMIVVVFVAISALVSVAYWLVDAFKLTALNSVKVFFSKNLWFMVQGTGYLAVNDFLVAQITALASIKFYILLGFDLLLLIWSITLLVKITNPKDHFCKFRPWTFVINLFFALFMILNICFAVKKVLTFASLTNILACVVSLLVILIFAIHFIMNLRGMDTMREEKHDPNDIFPQQDVEQPEFVQQTPPPHHPPHMPPPPPSAQ